MKPVAYLIAQKGRPDDPLDAALPPRARSISGDRYETMPLFSEIQVKTKLAKYQKALLAKERIILALQAECGRLRFIESRSRQESITRRRLIRNLLVAQPGAEAEAREHLETQFHKAKP